MSSKTRTFLSPAKPANKAAEGDALLDGRYRIVRLLGEGGMGAVYLASHVGLGRDVAIKFMHAEFISSEDVVGRFHREAQAAAADSPERASTCAACRERANRQRRQAIGGKREEIQEDTVWDCGTAGNQRPSSRGSYAGRSRPERRQAWGQEAAQGRPRHRDVRGV